MELLISNLNWGPQTAKLPFQYGILCGIKSLRSLFKEVKNEGWEYLLTARLNQDVLENFFSQIRGLGGNLLLMQKYLLEIPDK